MLIKELLYTKKNWRSVSLGLLAPFAIIFFLATMGAGRSGVLQLSEDLTPAGQLSPTMIFLSLYAALSFTTVFRSVNRVRHEGLKGTGAIYLFTGASPAALVGAKWLVEASLNSLALLPPIVTLHVVGTPGFGWSEVIHLFTASFALSALAITLSSTTISDEGFYLVTLSLTLGPLFLIPGEAPSHGGGLFGMLYFVPTFGAFLGVRDISLGNGVSLWLPLTLAIQAALLLPIMGRCYHRLLVNTVS